MTSLSQYPALAVEVGAVVVLVAALLARVLMRRFGIPSIVTLLACGLAAGPSGLGFLDLNLTQPATRALLSLAVVVVLFEATLRMDLTHVPKRVLAVLAIGGPAAVLAVVPALARAAGLTHVVAVMVAAVCVVTGPTVTGPLLARLRVRTSLSHLLEVEGLVLDALGVIIAAAIFTSFTSRPEGAAGTMWHTASRIGTGLLVGGAIGYLGKRTMPLAMRLPSDVSKLYALLLGFGAYALAEYLAHESGLTAVIACGLLLDLGGLPHERLVRSFKEDLSMLALSTVFVLLASQIRLDAMRPLVGVGLALVAALIALRVLVVLLATVATPYSWRERIFMMTLFPRGIVAVSLATYYATQLPAWGIRGGTTLAGTLFLVIVFTVVLSSASAILVSRIFALQMSAVLVVGISSQTVDLARSLSRLGYLVLLADDEERRVAFGRANDLDSVLAEDAARVVELIRERNTRIVILGRAHRWPDLLAQRLPRPVTPYAICEDGVEVPGWRALRDLSDETLRAQFASA